MRSIHSQHWLSPGDINGFLGLVVDNLSIMAFLATALIGIFGFPADIVFLRMFPGTTFGVLVGASRPSGMAVTSSRPSRRASRRAMAV